MSSKIDSVSGDLPFRAAVPRPVPAVPADPKLHAERLARWKDIKAAGTADKWIHAQLIAKGHTPDEDPSKLSDADKKGFKERKVAERAEKKALFALARDARRAALIVHLGHGVHWDEIADADTFDLKNRAERAEQNGLPPIENAEALAEAMGLSVARLRWLTFQRPADTGTHYRRWVIPKRSGGERVITSPKQSLMAAQHWALRNVFEKLPVHGAAHGFLAGRSVATNAAVHAGADLVLKVDIKDFFPTVTWRRVKGLLRKAGMAEQPATLLSLLVCEAPRQLVDFKGKTMWVATGAPALPQGAPTSPAVTNAICWRMDRRLSALARTVGFTYSRYADDLAFSYRKQEGKKRTPVGILFEGIKAILKSEGFVIHPDKTAVLRRGTQQRITGLVVNRAGPNVPAVRVPRDVVRRLRAAIHNRQKGKPGKEGESLAQLQGMAAWIFMTDPKRGARFLEQVAALEGKAAG